MLVERCCRLALESGILVAPELLTKLLEFWIEVCASHAGRGNVCQQVGNWVVLRI